MAEKCCLGLFRNAEIEMLQAKLARMFKMLFNNVNDGGNSSVAIIVAVFAFSYKIYMKKNIVGFCII